MRAENRSALPEDMIESHDETQRRRLRHARRVFKACLGYTFIVTILWLFVMITGIDGGLVFGRSRPTLQEIGEAAGTIIFLWMVWSYAFYWLKYGLLKRA